MDIGPGAALVLRTVAATLLLPGPRGEPSRSEFTARVGENATLVWLPGPTIAARGCNHRAVTRISLERGARLVIREELLLGRHGERPGTVRQRLRVGLTGRPLYDQELAVGPEVEGWNSAAVIGGRRAIGSMLIVDPLWEDERYEAPTSRSDEDVALLPLGDSAVLIMALGADGLALGERLATVFSEIDGPSVSIASTS